MRAWIGLVILCVWIGGAYLRVRARRRSGAIKDFGHPVLDQFLLLVSGLLLSGLMGVAFFLFAGFQSHPVNERILIYGVGLAAGGSLTWLCNALLRRVRRRKQPREEGK